MSTHVQQVAGNHYNYNNNPDQIGHWDYVGVVNAPYLEGNASKYVDRWRKKNGVQDLRKAVSYLHKRVAIFKHTENKQRGVKKDPLLFNRYLIDNKVPIMEAIVIDAILHWEYLDQLIVTIDKLEEMIRDAETGPTSAYVDQDR